jgi:peptide/nickel transport system permease protein
MSIAATGPVENEGGLLRSIIRIVGLSGLGLMAIIVALGDVVARAPAGAVGRSVFAPPDVQYPFGTDGLGRDMLSETLHGLGVTMTEAAPAALIVIVAGAIAGFAAVRAPLRLGIVLRALTGLFGAVPVLLLAVALVGLFGRNFAILAAGLAAAPPAFIRSYDSAAHLANSRHAEFARATGIPGGVLLRRDLVYEIRNNFVSVAARALASVVIALSTMSFLGFGAGAPQRDLGLIIADARAHYLDAWWTAAFPALVLALLILFARLAAALQEGEPP